MAFSVFIGMAQRKRHYGLKFPFTAYNMDGYALDLNSDAQGKAASEIAHVLLTPKGTRLRMPEFGTDLVRYIFEPNDTVEWTAVENEAREAVARYVRGAELKSIVVSAPDSDPHAIHLQIVYGLTDGRSTTENKMMISL